MTINLPETTAKRLPIYYRYLKNQLNCGKERISSQEVSAALHLDPGTVRKDFSNLGEFGRRGYGYDVAYLERFIAHLMHHDQPLQVVFIGTVEFYQLICENPLMLDEGYEGTAIFTTSQAEMKAGFAQLPLYALAELPAYAAGHAIDIAILAVSTDLQNTAESVVRAGIRAILNCSTQVIRYPEDVSVQHVDILGELHTLSLRRIYTH